MWVTTRTTDTFREITNTETGAIRQIKLASDKQWDYLETLRKLFGAPSRLKNRPSVFQAKKQIDKLNNRKITSGKNQQRLL